MPKIIENLPQRLKTEAWQQIRESGYSAMTIRSVAKSCGVGVGTVYNYFPSKEALVAAFMLEDWEKCIVRIQSVADSARDCEPVLWEIHERLLEFAEQYAPIFQDETAALSFSGSFSPYHKMLCNQLAKPIRRFCRNDFAAEFVAEALLIWTVRGVSFDELLNLLKPILQKP